MCVLLAIACGDSGKSGPTEPAIPDTLPRTLTLTSVSGKAIPTPYYRLTTVPYNYENWADSGTVTIQADSLMIFRAYWSSASPAGAPHPTSGSKLRFSLTRLRSSGMAITDYGDGVIDTAWVLPDGHVEAAFYSQNSSGQLVSLGRWQFRGAYHGPPIDPLPTVASFVPALATQFSGTVTLSVSGHNFTPATVVTWDQTTLPIAYQDAQHLSVTIDSMLAGVVGKHSIWFANPGGTAIGYTFQVVAAVPVLSWLSPPSANAGSSGMQLIVHGSKFNPSSVVNWNGTPRTTMYTSPTDLLITLSDADLATAQTVQISVTTPAPGGGTSGALPFSVTGIAPKLLAAHSLAINARALVADPTRSAIYASVDALDASYPNSVVALDPVSGAVVWSLPIAGTPDSLAISDDGQYLYVAALADAAITRIALATHTIDLRIPLGQGPYGAYRARHMAVAPGQPHTVAVQRSAMSLYPPSGDVGLTIYDDAVARANELPVGVYLSSFSFGPSGAIIYAGAPDVTEYAVDASGVTTRTIHRAALPNGSFINMYVGGKIVDAYGGIYDLASGTSSRISAFPPFNYTLAVSTDARTLYIVSSMTQRLAGFDLVQGSPTGAVAIPGSGGTATNLVRWGSDGVAFLTPGKVYLVRSDMVH